MYIAMLIFMPETEMLRIREGILCVNINQSEFGVHVWSVVVVVVVV